MVKLAIIVKIIIEMVDVIVNMVKPSFVTLSVLNCLILKTKLITFSINNVYMCIIHYCHNHVKNLHCPIFHCMMSLPCLIWYLDLSMFNVSHILYHILCLKIAVWWNFFQTTQCVIMLMVSLRYICFSSWIITFMPCPCVERGSSLYLTKYLVHVTITRTYIRLSVISRL